MPDVLSWARRRTELRMAAANVTVRMISSGTARSARRAQEREHIGQLLITQAIQSERRHQRGRLADNLAQIGLQISMEVPAGVHDLNRERVFALAYRPDTSSVASDERDRLVPGGNGRCRVANRTRQRVARPALHRRRQVWSERTTAAIDRVTTAALGPEDPLAVRCL